MDNPLRNALKTQVSIQLEQTSILVCSEITINRDVYAFRRRWTPPCEEYSTRILRPPGKVPIMNILRRLG